jgi:hypothetical protein
MDNSLKNIMSSTSNTYKNLQSETRGTVSKWNKTGLLEGIDNDYERHGMAIMLENQAKQLVTEASRTGTAEGSEEWSGVALPLVRRVFSEIAAKDFVSVQPMNLPSGLVFYLDFKYSSDQPGFQTGAGKDSQLDSVFGVTNTADTVSEGLYGAGRFGYSINETSSLAQANGAVPAAGTFVTASTFDWGSDLNYDSNVSASLAGSGLYKLTVATAALPGYDSEGVRAFEITGDEIDTYYPAYTTINGADTQISFVVSASAAVGLVANTISVNYQLQPTDITRGDFEAGQVPSAGNPIDTNINIPELNIEMRSEAIVAKTRKLKAIWTPEFAQDLNAYHSIDAENELTSMLSEYISQEIDLEILDMLIQNAVTTNYWSAKVGRIFNKTTQAFEQDGALVGQAYNQGTWFQTLGTKLQDVSNTIHQKTMRGGANFCVVSPKVATILESIPGYAADTDGSGWGTNGFAMGVQKVGSLNSRFQVYKNPYMLENVILTGYRGSQFLETGAVYAPYIPLIMTPLVYDPNNFTPRKGVMTRYAKKMIRPEFYGKVYVDGLESL